MKRVFCLTLCIVCIALCLGVNAGAARQTQTQPFVPVLRFVASSDTHVMDDNDTNAARIGTMMDIAYRFAAEDPAYAKVDALLVCGDLTHAGTETEFEKFQSAITHALHPETELLAVGAKNHDGYHLSRATERETVSALTGKDADFHVVIGGYHFIGISVSSHPTKHYDKEQLAWLDEQLEAANEENPAQPVFVMHHEHVKNTVYGSSSFERWGVPYFNEILEQYPQVVDFSGHSHYPLNHPNSVWQGAFTAIGTGAVKSVDFTVEDLRDIAYSPENADCSTFWIVEADKANNLRLRGIDLLAQKVLCEYYLENPANPQNRAFSPENKAAASTPPVFQSGAPLQVDTDYGSCSVTVPVAASTDSFPVVLYRAYAIDADGKTVSETWTQPTYMIADSSDTVTLTLQGLSKGEYTVKVVAETAYGVQSDALETQADIEAPNAFVAFFMRIVLWLAHLMKVIRHAIF